MVFSTRLLTQKSSGKDKPVALDGEPVSLTIRATKMTATLKGIRGYSHDGLNE